MQPSPVQADQSKENRYGYLTVLMWSFSALAIGWTTEIPPLLLPGLTSVIGFFFFALSWVRTPAKLKAALRQPWPIWLLFFAAVVVYRGLFLAGLKMAPLIEANLLNYLWPLLIVLLPALIDRHKLSKNAVIGAVLCFAGVICIGFSKKGGGLSFEPGHLLAIAAAVTWAVYSILTRRFPAAPTDMIGVMHVVAAALFLSLHYVFEQPVDIFSVPLKNWAGILCLALAISLGYSFWDRAMTHGNRETVAVAAYYTPLLSTLWLILFGDGHMNLFVWLAAAFILGGSLYVRLTASPTPKKGNII